MVNLTRASSFKFDEKETKICCFLHCLLTYNRKFDYLAGVKFDDADGISVNLAKSNKSELCSLKCKFNANLDN